MDNQKFLHEIKGMCNSVEVTNNFDEMLEWVERGYLVVAHGQYQHGGKLTLMVKALGQLLDFKGSKPKYATKYIPNSAEYLVKINEKGVEKIYQITTYSSKAMNGFGKIKSKSHGGKASVCYKGEVPVCVLDQALLASSVVEGTAHIQVVHSKSDNKAYVIGLGDEGMTKNSKEQISGQSLNTMTLDDLIPQATTKLVHNPETGQFTLETVPVYIEPEQTFPSGYEDSDESDF